MRIVKLGGDYGAVFDLGTESKQAKQFLAVTEVGTFLTKRVVALHGIEMAFFCLGWFDSFRNHFHTWITDSKDDYLFIAKLPADYIKDTLQGIIQ